MRKNTLFSLLAAALLVASIFVGCQKEISGGGGNGGGTPTTPPDLTTKVNSSVSGFVVNENNQPVLNATVQAGTSSVTTDKYGFFEIKNISVIKNAATVTIIKTGYFKAIKTYTAVAGKSAFFRIKLIPKTNSGTVNANTGGVVTLTNGLAVTLPANAVVNASTNAAYNGTINVAAHWINPTGNDINSIMPGDLRGLTTEGNLRLLASFGMAAIELTGSGGELLQIAPGKKASLNFPIPSSQLGTAPATIPLWYFDETLGLWKQEGSATKTGNNYVGDVNHFTVWNCDDPSNFVQVTCTVVNANGQPVPYAYVKVTDGYFYSYCYTDSAGYASCYAPINRQLTLKIYDNSTCSDPVYSQAFTTTTVNVSLGTIVIDVTGRIATLTGSVKDCNGAAVTNGYILISDGNILNRYPVSNTGTYSVNKLFCSFPTSLNLIGVDVGNTQQSLIVTYMVTNPGVNNVPNIVACGASTQEFVNYSDNGVPIYNYLMPGDTITWYSTPIPPTNPTAYTGTVTAQTVPQNNNYISFTFGNTNVTVGSIQVVSSFGTFSSNSYLLNSGTVTITEYGPIGQFVAGTFSVSKTDITNGQNHTFTGSFRVRRSN